VLSNLSTANANSQYGASFDSAINFNWWMDEWNRLSGRSNGWFACHAFEVFSVKCTTGISIAWVLALKRVLDYRPGGNFNFLRFVSRSLLIEPTSAATTLLESFIGHLRNRDYKFNASTILIFLSLILFRIRYYFKVRLLSKNLKIGMQKSIILPVVLYGCETWPLTLREEHRLRVFENKVLRRIFGSRTD
jgi:hypothetical protein